MFGAIAREQFEKLVVIIIVDGVVYWQNIQLSNTYMKSQTDVSG